MGVRISWLMLARNSLLARLADSAMSLATRSCSSVWRSSLASCSSSRLERASSTARDSAAAVLSATRQLQRGVELLQLMEAVGVFQGGAGDGGDEVRQSLFVRAEQLPHLVVRHVEAGGGAAADENRARTTSSAPRRRRRLGRPRRARLRLRSRRWPRFQRARGRSNRGNRAVHRRRPERSGLRRPSAGSPAPGNARSGAAARPSGGPLRRPSRTKGRTRSYGRPPARSGNGRQARAWSAGQCGLPIPPSRRGWRWPQELGLRT